MRRRGGLQPDLVGVDQAPLPDRSPERGRRGFGRRRRVARQMLQEEIVVVDTALDLIEPRRLQVSTYLRDDRFGEPDEAT
jgi:hypothetical protein